MVGYASKLKALRGGRTLREVAAAVGIHYSTLARYEHGDRVPSDPNKVKLADFYGKTVQELFFDN